MKNKTNDIWFNIYTFLLLPLCIIINIYNIFKYITNFNSLNNMFVTIIQLLLAIISIILYGFTLYYAKDRVKVAYNLIIVTVFYSIIVASFNQVLETYYNQGVKTYIMFIVYVLLFICCYGLLNYVYFKRRKDMFGKKIIMSKDELKKKIEEAKNNKLG